MVKNCSSAEKEEMGMFPGSAGAVEALWRDRVAQETEMESRQQSTPKIRDPLGLTWTEWGL